MKTETENSQSWPADKIERRSVESLIPYARNARTHSDAQVAQIAASIKEWGWTTPVLVDEDGEIIAGHGRVMAARKLGIEEVPTMTATGWTKAQKQAYVLADNQLPQNAGWDMDLLKIEMQDLDGEGFDLELLGFSVEFMDGLFYEPKYEPGTEGDQGKLDELAPKMVECPHCGGNFDLRENGQG
jgi:ParB-like chromosome segregation protein Spo0J